ncbi:MAG TPA: hypothetical protein VE914_15555 [Candidatus Angelobacter sp.]|nr:hypothetical protein [Candidatus Angelobacter sp.]
MRKFFFSLFMLVLVVIVVGLGVSAFYEVSPPTMMMEKTISNELLKPK